MPIGNLTSQIFANIYLNEFDRFVKHELKIKQYARYTDDFIIIADSVPYLRSVLPRIEADTRLRLSLHQNKIILQPCHRGVDFLGYVLFPYHRLLRPRTRKRMFQQLRRRIREHKSEVRTEQSLHQVLQSYLGVLSHANTYKISQHVKNQFWFWLSGDDF